jgi:hypothetical protein
MFADSGAKAPPGLAPVPPERVARAVVQGIERGRLELDVAPFTARAGAVVGGIAPSLSAWFQLRMGGSKRADSIAEGQAAKR